jgi:uncharacterized membrane protein
VTSTSQRDLEDRVTRLEQALDTIKASLERLNQAQPHPRAVDPGFFDVSRKPHVTRDHAQASPPEFPSPEWFAVRSAEWWVGSLGVVFLVIASFLLYRYAVDHEWITPLVRVLMGVVIGGGMLVAARRFTSRDATAERDSLGLREILLGGGLAVWYLTSYAAAIFYQLIPTTTARACFLFLSIVSGWLALNERRILFAIIALGVGFAAPTLLESPSASMIGLAFYLAPLVALGLVLYLMRGWESILWITFAGFLFDLPPGFSLSLSVAAASVFTLLLIAASAAFVRAPILRRRLVALDSDRYGGPGAAARAGLWVIPIATPILALGMLTKIWPRVPEEFWGIMQLALAIGAYALSRQQQTSDGVVKHLELTAAAIWSLVGLEWIAIAIISRAGLDTEPIFIAVATIHSALLMLILPRDEVSTPRAIAKATAVVVLLMVLMYELGGPRPSGLHWNWTIAEAFAIALTVLMWRLLNRTQKRTVGIVFAVTGYGILLLMLTRVLGSVWLPLVTASYAVAGVTLLIVSRQGEDRKLLFRLGGLTMAVVVGRLMIVDMSSVETIWRVLLFLACGVAFVGASYGMQSPKAIPSVGSNGG